MSQCTRPTYTEDQVKQYLEYVGMPECISKESCDTQIGLEYLNKLVLLQLRRVPFENLDLHYSPHHTISLDTEYLFNKIVDRKVGRGGYCMQNNLFFATILRSLGYKVMPCGARVSSAAEGNADIENARYSGWSHTVNLLSIEGKKYFVDVGFGANCPSRVIPLIDGWTGRQTWKKDGDDMLLQHSHIPENTFRFEEQKLWIYHFKFGPDKPWAPMYCFHETEFLPQDFFAASYYVSHSLHSWFTYMVICRTVIIDDEGNDIGDLSLFNNVVKERRYGKSRVLFECKSEKDRVQALEKHFDIKLDASEVNGITGYVSMLR